MVVVDWSAMAQIRPWNIALEIIMVTCACWSWHKKAEQAQKLTSAPFSAYDVTGGSQSGWQSLLCDCVV